MFLDEAKLSLLSQFVFFLPYNYKALSLFYQMLSVHLYFCNCVTDLTELLQHIAVFIRLSSHGRTCFLLFWTIKVHISLGILVV